MPIKCTGDRFLSLEMRSPDYADRLGVMTDHDPESPVWRVAPDCLPGVKGRKLFLDTEIIQDCKELLLDYADFGGLPPGSGVSDMLRMEAYHRFRTDLMLEFSERFADHVLNDMGCLMFEIADPYDGQLRGPIYLIVIDQITGDVNEVREVGSWNIGEIVESMEEVPRGRSVVVSLVERAHKALIPNSAPPSR